MWNPTNKLIISGARCPMDRWRSITFGSVHWGPAEVRVKLAKFWKLNFNVTWGFSHKRAGGM